MRRSILGICLLGFFLFGCGGSDSGPVKYTVTGTVKFQGKPLVAGNIDFIPESGDTSGTVATTIMQGQFEFPGAAGVPAGKYKVSITGGFSGEAPNPSGEEVSKGSPIVKIPEKYNAQTILRAEVAEGKTEFHFDDLK